ncbi:MAG TPA: DUF2163 domain-containing protein [Stellaceae bacterium]|nr:DUF2163 domain-containing protein [Stellaceae bacterium]
MKTASAELVGLLNGNQFYMADLYTFTCADGTVLRYTTTDIPISLGGNVFSNASLRIDGFKYKLSLGVSADEMELKIYALPTDTAGAVSFFQRIMNGGFDGCAVRVERLFSAYPGDNSAGTVELFTGKVSQIKDVGRTSATITAKSALELLDIQMPRNTYQPSCVHTLYDPGCGLNPASFTAGYSVGSGSTVSSIVVNGIDGTVSAHAYDSGTITFITGLNTGTTRTIRLFVNAIASLAYPLPIVPAVGDGFTITMGCDKTSATCSARFNNLGNWRGFPLIPQPVTAY